MALLLPLPEVEENDEDEALLLELEERRRRRRPPQIKMKLAPYAMYCVFSGGTSSDSSPYRTLALCAYTGIHFVLYFVRFLFLSPVPEVAALWGPIHFAIQCICCAATTLVMCAFIRWYMAVDGVYHVEFVPPPEMLAAAEAPAAVQQLLPPPPPEMDMC
ncbi:unnamed protein product [Urochloa decumbens]|uniref:Uncharacterized protein n=1 Tax=Urochloa decumbens TaxID=240449 RepID=A0ABC9H3L9_9POAL